MFVTLAAILFTMGEWRLIAPLRFLCVSNLRFWNAIVVALEEMPDFVIIGENFSPICCIV